MSYELQIYAPGPEPPSVAALLEQTAESGVGVEVVGSPTSAAGGANWSKLTLRAAESEATSFSIEAADELARMKALLAEDAEAGEDVPAEVLAATRLYVMELGEDADEAAQAAFVVTAWGLAALTDGVVFDPQEEFFADAESFWGLVMDSGMEGSDMEASGGEDDEEAQAHGGGCCGGGHEHAGKNLFMPSVPRALDEGRD